MESFTPSAAAAADPSQASLDQASFTEMFHSSPAATPADTGERFRNPAGQFAPRNLNKTELPATEPRPAVELGSKARSLSNHSPRESALPLQVHL